MPKGMQAIYSQTFASNGQANFYNIPQTYTDLKIVVSQRNGSSNLYESLAFRFDSTASVYTATFIYGDGSSAASGRVSASAYFSYGSMSVNGGNSTANSFGSYEIYIPNYTSTMQKQFTVDCVTTNNGSAAHADLVSGLYNSNSPITFFQVGGYTIQPVAGTTVTIYGISR